MTTGSPNVFFGEKLDWSSFKQEVMTALSNLGSIAVSVDPNQRIFVFAFNETTHYYYQVK